MTSYGVGGQVQHWFRNVFRVAGASHCLSEWWPIDNLTSRDERQWNSKLIATISFQKTTCKNVVCKKAAVLLSFFIFIFIFIYLFIYLLFIYSLFIYSFIHLLIYSFIFVFCIARISPWLSVFQLWVMRPIITIICQSRSLTLLK